MIKQVIEQEKERLEAIKREVENRKKKDIDDRLNEAATRIQRAYRRKKEGKSMIMHIKDVMKKLMEAEKAKVRLETSQKA